MESRYSDSNRQWNVRSIYNVFLSECVNPARDVVFVVNSSAQIHVASLSDGSYENWDLATLASMSSTTRTSHLLHWISVIDAEVQNAVSSMLYYGIDNTNASPGIIAIHDLQRRCGWSPDSSGSWHHDVGRRNRRWCRRIWRSLLLLPRTRTTKWWWAASLTWTKWLPLSSPVCSPQSSSDNTYSNR